MKRHQPPDLFPDDLNCLLNICDCSVTMVGDERLSSSSINRALAALASSHISLSLVAYSLLFSSLLLHHGQEQEKWRLVAPFRRQAEVRADSSLRGLQRFRVLGGGVLLLSPKGRQSTPLPWHRPMTRMIPRGSPPRCGPISGPSSALGSRARMSRRSPRTRRTPLTHLRRGAAVTTTARAMVTTETTAMVMATAARAMARAAVAAARPVAKRH
jgi:hypothetical protein